MGEKEIDPLEALIERHREPPGSGGVDLQEFQKFQSGGYISVPIVDTSKAEFSFEIIEIPITRSTTGRISVNEADRARKEIEQLKRRNLSAERDRDDEF